MEGWGNSHYTTAAEKQKSLCFFNIYRKNRFCQGVARNIVNLPHESYNFETMPQQENTREQDQILENARKAKETADQLFPNETWVQNDEWGDNIFVTARKKGTSFDDELRSAQILRDLGNTVYLVPEPATSGGKFDAIVNGLKFEFKTPSKANTSTLSGHFLKSREQASNVFFNLENSALSKSDVTSALASARNRQTHTDRNGVLRKGYDDINQFTGGRIILKLQGRNKLIYLNVDDLRT